MSRSGGRQHSVPLLVGHLVDHGVPGEASVVYDDVDFAVAKFGSFFEQVLVVGWVDHVARDGNGGDASSEGGQAREDWKPSRSKSKDIQLTRPKKTPSTLLSDVPDLHLWLPRGRLSNPMASFPKLFVSRHRSEA